MPKVACTVSNCTYWAENNLCSAENILIEIDKHAAKRFSEEFASEDFSNHHDKAANSSATCCLTFKQKK